MQNSEIILVRNIKLDKKYNNVLSYSQTQMLSLCRSNAIATKSDYSFIRENSNSIFSGFTYSQCLQANYIAFQNKDYNNKWFFAFIDEVNYVSNKNTEIKYTIDVFSTFYDDWTAQKCFITRQHCYDDTIGLHTIDEDLHVSDYENMSSFKTNYLGEEYYYTIFSTYNPATRLDFNGAERINGAIFGCFVFAFDNTGIGVAAIRSFINDCNDKKRIDSILGISYAPKRLIDSIGKTSQTVTDFLSQYSYYVVTPDITGTGGNNAIYENELINIEYSFDDYTPKNNKCFCYPYFYLNVNNNIGNSKNYKIEEFEKEIVGELTVLYFRTEMALSIGCSIRTVPKNYMKKEYSNNEAIPLAKYPTAAWAGDNWTNWLSENAVNTIGDFSGLIGSAISLAMGNVPIAIATGSSTVGNLIGRFDKNTLQGSNSGGSNNGDVNFSSKNNCFTFSLMRAKLEDLKIIDDYFSKYGYKVNKLEQPNLTHRQNWNYVEIGANENIGYGSVPSKYMEEINNAFRKGVTIWHNHTNLGNYNLNNNITN